MREIYGSSNVDSCIFCSARALALNEQQFPVCTNHRNAIVNMDKLKCPCGSYLDIKKGKYGAFFLCMNCGPRSISKIRELNEIEDSSGDTHRRSDNSKQQSSTAQKISPEHPKEYTITTNDADYF